VEKGDVWKYSDAGAKPAEDWFDPDYDDSSWSSGASRLGFANSGTFGTTLNRYVGGGSSGTQVTTYYFRKTFTMPAGAGQITSLKAALDCDDGYIAYINGVEVKRDQVASADYSAFSTATNMGEKDDTFTFPAGTLVEGDNVIAVEVHQCNASSSDAWWNLALSYEQALNAEGGLAVPVEGMSLAMRVLSPSGEWSALSTVNVRGEMPQAAVADGLRLAEALTAAVDGDDTLDYLVVTNVAAGEIQLDGVKIVAWNAKKNTEAKPSLTYFFPVGTSLRPGASLRIGNLDKLTNSQVGLRIYDAESQLVQDVYLDAGWWNGACDETGEHFIAKTFGAEAKTHADWKPSATAFSASVRVLEMYTSTTGGGDTGEFIVLTNLDASAELDLTDVKLVAWNSKKKSESDPSLTIVLDGVTIPVGGTLKLDQATYFGGGKLTNSKVGLKIYDPAESCAQEVEVDASWWNSACDGTGVSFVALEFGDTVKAEAQWKPSFVLPVDDTGKASVLAAISADDRIRTWLGALSATDEGVESITNFTGTADAVNACYLVNAPLETDPELGLSIESITFDAAGNVVIGGELTLHGVESGERTINGLFKLYHAATLDILNGAGDGPAVKPLGSAYPIPESDCKVEKSGPSRFYRLTIE